MSKPPDGEQPEQQALLQRLRSAYVSSSLTILSIIQGVALAALGATVGAHAVRLAPAQWLMVIVTFGALVAVWTHVSMDTMTWVMVPDFSRILVPFSVGAVELLIVAAITINLSVWLFGGAVIIALSSVSLVQVTRLAEQEPDNAPLLAHLSGQRHAAYVYNLVGAALYVLLAVVGLLGRFSSMAAVGGVRAVAATLAGALAGLWIVGWLLRSATYWRKIVAYARTET